MRRKVIITDSIGPGCTDYAWEDEEYEDFARDDAEPAVRVTDIEAKRRVWLGTEVPVRVTVTNFGDYPMTTDLTLEDTTKDVIIGTRMITIPPRDSEVVTFIWKTKRFSLGDHMLYAHVPAEMEQCEPCERPWSARRGYRGRVDYGDDCQPYPRSDGEANAALAEADQILRRAEREWEDAESARVEAQRYRERAGEKAARAVEEVYDQLQPTIIEELEEVRASRAEAEAARAQAQRELEEIRAAKAEAERYAEQIEAEARKQAEEIYEQFRLAAEEEARQLREEGPIQARKMLAEAEAARTEAEAARAEAQRQLEEAMTARAEAEHYAEQIDVTIKRQVEEAYEQFRLAAEREAQQLRDGASQQTEKLLAEAEAAKAAAERELEEARASRAEAAAERELEEARASRAEAEAVILHGLEEGRATDPAEDCPEQTSDESALEIVTIGEKKDTGVKLLVRWEWIVIVLALVTAAISISLGLFSVR